MDLGYFNARLRGFRGRLIGHEQYESLIRLTSPGDYLERMRGTYYGPDIEKAGARFEGAEDIISEALKQNLISTFSFLWKITPGEARPLVKALVSFWEVYN